MTLKYINDRTTHVGEEKPKGTKTARRYKNEVYRLHRVMHEN